MDFKKICFNCMQEKPSVDGFCSNCGFKNEDYSGAANELPPLTPLNGKYLLGRSLGSGGFGITYLALDTNLKVVVAIKELFLKKISVRSQNGMVSVSQKDRRCFEDNKRRFLKEAQVLAMFSEKDNEGVVQVKDYFEEKNTAYIVMEYLNGVTLREEVKRIPLTFDEMRDYMEPICHALMKIHQFNVVHLDVTPDNIILLENQQAKLLDFGVAKTIGEREINDQYSFKRGYSPLEQRRVNGRIGEWTDVYSTAATMYYCLTGEKTADADERAAGEEVIRPSDLGVKISANAENAIMRALEMEPEDRYQTMDEFWDDLNSRTKTVNKKLLCVMGIIAIIAVLAVFEGIKLGSGGKTTNPKHRESGGIVSADTGIESTESVVKDGQGSFVGKPIDVNLGTYIFENASDRNLIMGVDRGLGDDGTPLTLNEYEFSNKNRFLVTDEIADDGFYNLRAAHTNSFIETADSKNVGEVVRQFAKMTNDETEKWQFVYCGHDDEKDMDEVIIINAAGSVLAPKDGCITSGTEIVLTDYDQDEVSQKWFMRWNAKNYDEKDVVVNHE